MLSKIYIVIWGSAGTVPRAHNYENLDISKYRPTFNFHPFSDKKIDYTTPN